MPKHHWETLEYPKILTRLTRYADFSGGAELALALTPAPDYREARERLTLTTEARALLMAHPDFGLGGVTDIRPWVQRAQHGAVLDPGDLLQIRETLLGARRVYRILTRLEAQFPGLADIAWRIGEQPPLVEAIGRVLNERGEVRDNASPELARIRREQRKAQDRVQERLRRMVTSPDVARYLQDNVITRREGRYVIPVKADFKGKVPGIVHDRSSSGVTLFMEPLAVVGLNNALREFKLAEREEVTRLLATLTRQVATAAEELAATVTALAELDLTCAKARYAEDLAASQPELLPLPAQPPAPRADNLHGGAIVRLREARHPLLAPEQVVPVDVVLDAETHALIITGPNTGGKTVTLKTVGLLTLMAQAGMHIPVAPDSALSYFEAVYADIGDEQSIEQSLSTFSSHLGNIMSFFNQVDHRSLVLLDELGAGTDPTEGAALARALMGALRQRRATILVATHYPDLKLYAHNTPGVRNASLEFDVETLRPTFHLTIGLPGRSNAFAIARRLGIPEPVVKAAQGMVSGEALSAEDMLADLHRLRLQTVRARDEARQARQDAEKETAALRERLQGIEKERRKILAQAEAEARAEVEQLQTEVAALRRRLLTVPAPELQDILDEVEAELEDVAEDIPTPAPLVETLLPLPEHPVGTPRPGDTVRVTTLGMEGVLVSLAGKEALVQAGALRTRVSLESLELLRRGQSPAPTAPTSRPRPLAASPGSQIDLRGQTVEEALQSLDHYLDDAAMANLPWVRIIHGKGTGTLRRAVSSFLRSHPLIVSYQLAEEREGGAGVTIAKLIMV